LLEEIHNSLTCLTWPLTAQQLEADFRAYVGQATIMELATSLADSYVEAGLQKDASYLIAVLNKYVLLSG
jgi:hypothetical protein